MLGLPHMALLVPIINLLRKIYSTIISLSNYLLQIKITFLQTLFIEQLKAKLFFLQNYFFWRNSGIDFSIQTGGTTNKQTTILQNADLLENIKLKLPLCYVLFKLFFSCQITMLCMSQVVSLIADCILVMFILKNSFDSNL